MMIPILDNILPSVRFLKHIERMTAICFKWWVAMGTKGNENTRGMELTILAFLINLNKPNTIKKTLYSEQMSIDRHAILRVAALLKLMAFFSFWFNWILFCVLFPY